ncbi:MAG TPA: amidohydrolase family protein [Ilumatobacter sp.]|nr:amidohydrolase family protein [Ilumatobacter sp.]
MSTETWDSIDRYVVISSDSHAGADLRDYKPYLPSKWHDDFDAWADAYDSPFDDLIHATAMRNWDSDFRIEEMNADGVAAEIIFPNTIPPFFPTSALIVIGLPKTKEEFAPRWAGVQAHNRWVVDFVAQAPKRRRGLVQILPNDVDAAIAEIEWAVSTGAFGGVLLATVPPGHSVPGLNDLVYEPLWSLCEELDLPIATHNVAIPEMRMDQPGAKALTMSAGGLWSQFALMQLILGGVFDRHPRLKLVPTESGVDWPLQTAMMLDHMLPGMHSDAANRTMGMFGDETTDNLSMTPTEFVKRQVYYGASGAVTPETFAKRDVLGVDHLMWGSDYPHEEGSTPQSKLAIRWAFNDVPVDETRQMLAGNIAGLYGFDLEALVPIAKEIGPEVSEVHRPITAGDADFSGETYLADFIPRPYPGGALLQRSRAADSAF